MTQSFHRAASSIKFLSLCTLLGILLILPLSGCKGKGHTSDPRLRQIDELLDAQLPEGSLKARVAVYLSSQGFPLQASNDPGAIVAIVHRVDTETLRPVTALVTFHFDARDKLQSYEIVEAPDSMPQP
jgi:hypothetical protein